MEISETTPCDVQHVTDRRTCGRSHNADFARKEWEWPFVALSEKPLLVKPKLQGFELRHQVAKAMVLKFAPELRFQLDETFDRLDETRRLFADERVRRDIERGDSDDDESLG